MAKRRLKFPYKKIEGKKFRFSKTHSTRASAEKSANYIRTRQAKRARVLKSEKGYDVYVRCAS